MSKASWRDAAFAHVRSAQHDWIHRAVCTSPTESEAVAFLRSRFSLSGSGGPGLLDCQGTPAGIEVFASEDDERRCPHGYHPGGYLGLVSYREIVRTWRAAGQLVQPSLFDVI